MARGNSPRLEAPARRGEAANRLAGESLQDVVSEAARGKEVRRVLGNLLITIESKGVNIYPYWEWYKYT